MILTNKALADFLIKVYYQEDTNQVGPCINQTEDELIQIESTRWISQQDDRFINSLIIEFFDSVGIYIDTESEEIYEYVGFYAYVNNESLNEIFKSRQEATEQAIIKANEIYNERTNISNKV